MTVFRLNAGRPAVHRNSGAPAFPPIAKRITARITNPAEWTQLTRLTCGCTIPGTLFVLADHAKLTNGDLILCDRHGWVNAIQPPQPKKGKRQCNPNQSIMEDPPPF